MNRPKSLSAINREFVSELDKLFEEIAGDDEILGVIITGDEKVFSVGADGREVRHSLG